MRLEIVPLIIGALIGLLGLGLIFDAWTPDEVVVKRERRRRARVERSRGGEALIGFGVIGMAAAFIGRDTWRYSVMAVIAGAVLLAWGAIANRRYIGASISNRGALRRREPGSVVAEAKPGAKPGAKAEPAEEPGAGKADSRDSAGATRSAKADSRLRRE